MAIQFEFYKNPQPEKEGEEPSYHPRKSGKTRRAA